jgi:hypothetical protein
VAVAAARPAVAVTRSWLGSFALCARLEYVVSACDATRLELSAAELERVGR